MPESIRDAAARPILAALSSGALAPPVFAHGIVRTASRPVGQSSPRTTRPVRAEVVAERDGKIIAVGATDDVHPYQEAQ